MRKLYAFLFLVLLAGSAIAGVDYNMPSPAIVDLYNARLNYVKLLEGGDAPAFSPKTRAEFEIANSMLADIISRHEEEEHKKKIIWLGIVAAFISAFIASFTAAIKNRGVMKWIIGSFFFPPALLILFFLPKLDVLKKCPFCAESIKEAALLCKHCGKDLPAAAEGS